MEHGLKQITFYVKKHIAPLAMYYSSRRAAKSARICETGPLIEKDGCVYMLVN